MRGTASMNLSFTRGDKEEACGENYNRFSAALGFSPRTLITSGSDQHTHCQCRVTNHFEERETESQSPVLTEDVNGMITNVPGLVL